MTKKKNHSGVRELAQVSRFGLIGIINTAIDFALLNIISRTFNVSDLVANIPATAVAMIFSFFANRMFVFRAGDSNKSIGRQALEFFPITMIGMFVIQSAVIYFLESIWTWPVDFVLQISGAIGLLNIVDQQFIVTNVVKVVATVASLSWNYIMYKKVVFKSNEATK